jgi:membrane-associated phospholipid phosphatase
MIGLSFGDLDYVISERLVNPHSVWAEIFNMFGELPFTLGMLIFVTVLYGGHKRTSKTKTILLSVISYPFILLFSYLVVIMPIRYYFEFDGGIPNSMQIVASVLALVLFISTLILINKKDTEFFSQYKKASLILGLLVITEVILVNVLKMVWARPRMRSISSIEQFKYWWEVNGFLNLEEFKSFPSGHTANAFAMIAGVEFISEEKETLKNKWLIFAFSWGILTAFSRVVLGAHFVSDVIFGGVVTITLFWIISKAVKGKQ